ncbi:interleukin-13 receptor subunit alpha-1 isoform X2 [Puntigrus tetrazona]|uniref:interleukin-13 receptor subunit alpha-1 isoform X2 n=1 Tax=Puntigrus tetrazona TaxID=1606681 RepID=UPI001C8A7385|nr:interleukin-13 receptor subunit alpha-1 isoform X2 [Puntigrus tetrazona]
MFRVWDVALLICFSASVLFVGAEGVSELPPPRNLTVKWETPFTLLLTWEKPKDLDPDCKVNYTVYVRSSLDCSSIDLKNAKRVQDTTIRWDISNVNGVCVIVAVNPDNCKNKKQSPYLTTIIPPPTAVLVENVVCEYSHNKLKCIWSPVVVVKDLGFYYWSRENNTLIKCNDMKFRECVIHDAEPKDTMLNMFYLFNGTYEGKPVNNTLMGDRLEQYVKLNKPQLTIKRDGQNLILQTTRLSDVETMIKNVECYEYNYTYSVCDKAAPAAVIKSSSHELNYDSNCMYKARVQIIISQYCLRGKSDLSDEVVYGENRDPNLPALLAVIIIPLIVSCCLTVSLVLLRRHKDIIFPKIPEPTLILKDMLINNIKMPDNLRSPSDGRLYVAIEEVVESKISVEPY